MLLIFVALLLRINLILLFLNICYVHSCLVELAVYALLDRLSQVKESKVKCSIYFSVFTLFVEAVEGGIAIDDDFAQNDEV